MFESAGLSTTLVQKEARLREIKEIFGLTKVTPCFTHTTNITASSYLDIISRYPVLSPSDQDLLARAYREGDEESGNILVLANLKFSAKFSMGYYSHGIDPLELMQEAGLGLLEALRRFDPDRGVKFISYAKFWIIQKVLTFIRTSHPLSGNTRAARKAFLKQRKVIKEFDREGTPVTPELLSEKLQIPVYDSICFLTFLSTPPVRLDTKNDDQLTPQSKATQENFIIWKDIQKKLPSLIQDFSLQLEERDKLIFTERTASFKPKSLSDLGTLLNLSKERIRQVESKIKIKFSSYLQTECGPDFLEDLFR